jgi:FdhD protein
MTLPPPVIETRRLAVSVAGSGWGTRSVAEETAIALTYNQSAYAVMMATPADLEDFGLGFSLNEGVARTSGDIVDLQLIPNNLGVEIRMTLTDAAADRTIERRRRLAGPVGCGLCGVESLTEALRPLPAVTAALNLARNDVLRAVSMLAAAQKLNRATHAVHAAGIWRPDRGLLAMREDVGRHNALDKLAGALARAGQSASEGVIVISSRVSVEMVQKAVMMGAPVLVAVSAPTALAVRTAQATGLTLVAVARDDGFEVFTSPQRLRL